ncbi:S-methyl-5-thioribose-1-phosphate isomerase [Caloramator australicus]|uniref:Methylthioribose-1-phosphate isomerase n=1 Tax=Caloramator australicus RC3 TaxID=857293 RepID=I7LHK6_9CLOT|nr:S-methyl-5-thioribose-1-phosphate isomerase [Caloramator australicus]CCJ34106.1 Methylthioribose-1-phosphate isomerase [Caloramator australicus RC3]
MKPIIWSNFKLNLLDQRLLPIEVKYIECNSFIDVAECIKSMVVRGAPAIGIAAAYGVVLGAKEVYSNDKIKFEKDMQRVFETLASTRPTAVNLFWALSRMKDKFYSALHNDNDNIITLLENEANDIFNEDLELNKKIGEYGAKLLSNKCTVLTHCNAGALATAGWGTALGVIRSAKEMGKEIKVFADETRPLLQGARLTAFELMSDGIDVTLISDNMAGYVMKLGLIDAIIVGADRIAANGDTANKIGTYSLSVLAKAHSIPFYIAAPYSTFDLNIKSGAEIPIEERSHEEVRQIFNVRIAPENVKVFNPSFDVTPNENITAIITDKGVIYPPFEENIKIMR